MKHLVHAAATLAVMIALPLCAQEFRSTISGAVTDPTGSGIPAAKIVVTETHTGTKIPTVTDAAGRYNAPFLLPGDYDIDAKVDGFKEAIRKGVHLGAGDTVTVDLKLELGNATQAIEVTEEVPQINTEN